RGAGQEHSLRSDLRPMARCLFVVEKNFVVAPRDMHVLLPGIVPEGNERFTAGDAISLRQPDGSIITERIASLEFMNPMPPSFPMAVVLKGAYEHKTCQWAPKYGQSINEGAIWLNSQPLRLIRLSL